MFVSGLFNFHAFYVGKDRELITTFICIVQVANVISMIRFLNKFSKVKKVVSLTFAVALLMMTFMAALNTVTAVPVVYNLSYQLNGGTNSVNNQAAYDDNDLPLSLHEPFLLGYQFLYWVAFCANGTNVPLYDSVIPEGTSGAITLVAFWNPTPIQYNFVYSLNGGTNAPGNPLQYHVACNFPMNITNPSKSGSVFIGWMAVYSNMTVTGPTINYSVPAGTTGDITLIAFWS